MQDGAVDQGGAIGGEGSPAESADLDTLAGGFTNDEPTPDPKAEVGDTTATAEESTDTPTDLAGEVPSEENPAGQQEQLELSDETEIQLDDAGKETMPLGEMRRIAKLFKGSKDIQAMRGAYLRAREEISNERKQFESERQPLLQVKQQYENFQQAYEADPVAFGLHAFRMGVQDGSVDRGLAEAVQAVVDEYAQNGGYNPHAMQARAATMAAQRQAAAIEEQRRVNAFKEELWALQDRNQRIFNDAEKEQLINAWQHLAVTKGGRPRLEDAWKLVQQSAPPTPAPKPVARPSVAKVVQQLRKPKPATTERPGGSGRGASSYTKNDLDRDLDFIAKM